jgi:hypothetical protein
VTLTFFTFIVCTGGVLLSGSGVVRLQVVLCLFGGAAAVLLPALGGATVTPAMLCLPFTMFHAWRERDQRLMLERVPRAGFWLTLLALWGLLGAYYLPRLLAGQVEILTIDRTAMDDGAVIYPLRPVSGNITQSGYAIGSACAFFAVRGLLSKPGRLERFRDAVLLLGGLNCFAALLGLAEYHLGLPSVLDTVRNAGYGMNRAYESGGLLRIQGTFPETSTFAGFTLPLFAFGLSLWMSGVRPLYSALVASVSLALLLASTSGTAYAGLVAYLGCLALGLLGRAYVHGKIPRLPSLAILACVALLAVGLAFSFELGVTQRVSAFFDETVLGKLDSVSGVERGAWNRQAWSNFIDTYGVGVGLGSARASSFPLVLLSNVGLIGTLLFASFLKQVLWTARGTAPDPVSRAAREAVLAALITATISATVFDLGVAFFAFAAASTVVPEPLETGSAFLA